MSLESSLVYARGLLTEQTMNGLWVFKICRASREIIEDVDDALPSPEYVASDVSPLLMELARAICDLKLDPDDSFAQYLPKFVQSVQDRLSDSQKYASEPHKYISAVLLPARQTIEESQEK